MKVKLNVATGISFPDGTAHIMNAGHVVDVHENQATYWVGIGHASLVPSSAPLSEPPPPMVRTNMEVGSDAIDVVVNALVKSAEKKATAASRTPVPTPAPVGVKPNA